MTAQVGPPELLFHFVQVKLKRLLLLLLLQFAAKVMMAMLLELMMTEFQSLPDFPHQLLQVQPPLRPLRNPHPLLPANHRILLCCRQGPIL